MKHVNSFTPPYIVALWLALLLVTSAPAALAQQQPAAPAEPCGSAKTVRSRLAADPNFAARYQANETYLRRLDASKSGLPSGAASAVGPTTQQVYTIPVVVHIIRSTVANSPASVEITAAQVQAQLDVLNEDMNAQNADLSKLASAGPFYNGANSMTAGNPRLRFCLAQRTPQGAATTGIERGTSGHPFS